MGWHYVLCHTKVGAQQVVPEKVRAQQLVPEKVRAQQVVPDIMKIKTNLKTVTWQPD